MMRKILLLAALLLSLLAVVSLSFVGSNPAQADSPTDAPCAFPAGLGICTVTSLLKGIFNKPVHSAGNYAPVTIGVTSAQILAASTATTFLDIVNDSASATIACAFGATAVINGAGSFTIPPIWHRSWEGTFVPTDAVNCIASAASTPGTLGVK